MIPVTTSRAERVDALISVLHERCNSLQENALVLFLRVLADRNDPDGVCRSELIKLASKLEYLLSADITSQLTQALSEQPTWLDLSGQDLKTLPSELWQLQSLETLDLGDNRLTTLPQEIGRLRHLRSLSLRGNDLESLPPEILQLEKLEYLDVRDTLLPLPPDILESSSRHELSDRIYMRLRQTLFNSGYFNSAERLRALFVDERIAAWRDVLPDDASNREERIYEVIEHLRSQYNHRGENALVLFLRVLSDHTVVTDVMHQELAQLANFVEQVLSSVSIHSRLPASTILNYYFQLQRDLRPLNEVKLLLVGEGGVGKTSLVKRLMYDTYDPDEAMTEGILVERWYTSLDDDPLRINVWDFGGQEIMHATHQFFLTKRSLYLVVIDARTGDRGLDYWLQIVRSYGGDSPIIVVINKADIRHLELDEIGLHQKYPNICAFIPTSCANEDHPGIAQLRQAILDQVAQMSHIRIVWSQPWFEIKTRLEEMHRELHRDYVSYDAYLDMCAEAGITAPVDSRTLITFLHDLGIVLNYHDDVRLQETNILNPEWVTQAVYTILNARQLADHRGILELSQLCDILSDEHCYPRHKHGFILGLMRKFELSFALNDPPTRYLIPDLLPKNEILLKGWPPSDENLNFQYRYSVLPGSIITRLIVRLHAHIYQDIVWRTGACLHYQQNLALVKADLAAGRLTISIIGNSHTRREFLAIIRDNLRSIHASFRDLTIAQYIPIPGHPGVYADYHHLLTLEQLGERAFVPPGLAQRIPLKPILDGIEPPELRGAISGISDELVTDLQQALAATGYCDDIVTLRAQLRESPIAPWRDYLPESSDPQTQAYEIIRTLHSRNTTNGQNALDLFLQWLTPQVKDQRQRAILITLSRQLITERAAYQAPPPPSDTAAPTFNITVKESQIGSIGTNHQIHGGIGFGQPPKQT
jgi:internalin A